MLEDRPDNSPGAPLLLDRAEKMEMLEKLNLGIIGINAVLLASVIALCILAHCGGNPRIWFLLLLVGGGVGVGNLAGFVYAAYGDENKRFEGLTGLFNGFMGGISVADLSRGDQSILVAAIRSAGRGCGLNEGRALVSLPFCAFAALGFISMYTNRKLIFNSLMAEQDQRVFELDTAIQRAAKALIQPPGAPPGSSAVGSGSTSLNGRLQPSGSEGVSPPNERPTLAPAARDAADTVSRLSFDELVTPDETLAWAKSTLAAGRYADSMRAFAKVVPFRLNDPETRMGHGLAMFYAMPDKNAACEELRAAIEQTTQATPRELIKNLYRSLTYCALYVSPPKGFSLAIEYGERYLADPGNPVDGGILANLAAAHGQKYRYLQKVEQLNTPEAIEIRGSALAEIKRAIAIDLNWKNTFRVLLQHNYPGKDPAEDDLEVFERDEDFRKVVGLPPETTAT